MLPRSLNELYENLRDFHVHDENGEITASARFISVGTVWLRSGLWPYNRAG